METKRITLATIKSFIKKNREKLFLQIISSFDGNVDGQVHPKNPAFTKAEYDATESKNPEYHDRTQRIKGAWFVGESRDYFQAFENDQFTGYRISNNCGAFILAIKKVREDGLPVLSSKQYKALEDEIYNSLMSNPDMGIGEAGECRDEAERIIKAWADAEQITILE